MKPEMRGSDSDGQAPSRKRSRTSANGDGEDGVAAGKKARGRPRVDTQDQTAADRRRTQIRLAQRAYRQRKETTIASLKDQNDRLQSVIEQMNTTFLHFNDAAVKSGLLQLNPRLAEQLKTVTESFVSLAKSSVTVEGSEDDEETAEPHESDPSQASQSQTAQNKRIDVGWGYSTTLEEPSSRRPASPSSTQEKSAANNDAVAPILPSFGVGQKENGTALMHYRRPIMADQIFSQGVSWDPPTTDQRLSSQQLPFGLVDMINDDLKPLSPHQNPTIFSVNIPTPRQTPPLSRLPTPPYTSISTKTPKPFWTYSHEETTFARRLTRAALETGFHLLSSSTQRPAAFEYVFRLSLAWMSLADLRDKFKELLMRSTNEELDAWEAPFIHLGGAGTHYPRKDEEGNIIRVPNAWTVRRIGPIDKKMIRAENADGQTHDLNLDLTGFEGEWFDAHDVQGYIEQEKGVIIDPRMSFIDAYVDEDQLPGTYADDYFTMNADLKTASPLPRMSSEGSNTPSFNSGSSSANSSSSMSTPPHVNGTNANMKNLFAPSETSFALDMSVPSQLAKMSGVDSTTFFDQPLGLDMAPNYNVGLHEAPMQSLAYPGQPLNPDSLGMGIAYQGARPMPVVKQNRKRAVLIDVSKLVDELIKHGVCLGRAPGFRRRDVDMAFQASLITAGF